MTPSQYIELAKQTANCKSNRQLAKLLGISNVALSYIETGVNTPTDTTILRLAQLADIAPEQALIDLGMWRNSGNPEALKVYQNIKNLLTGFSGLTSILLILCNSSFFELLSNLYYVYFGKIKLRKINYLGVNRFVTLTIF